MHKFIFCMLLGLSFGAQASSLKLEPAVGLGTSTLGLTVNKDKDAVDYNPTNGGYYFFSLGVNDFSGELKLPKRDDESILKKNGESRVVDYRLGLTLNRTWSVDLIYQKYEGYFGTYEETQTLRPDLRMARSGVNVYYTFNPVYSSALIDRSIWHQMVTQGSSLLGVSYNSFLLNGEPMLVQRESSLQEGRIQGVAVKYGYGQNWIWKNWFAGLKGLFGLSPYESNYDYSDKSGRSTSLGFVFEMGAAGGYQWEDSKFGLFSRTDTSFYQIDGRDLLSRSTLSGIYFSHMF